jgi:hypothetical protein
MAADWYPKAFAARIPWHIQFNTQSIATGVVHGLTAGIVTQIGKDATNVQVVLAAAEEVDNLGQAMTEFKDIMLDGSADAELPPTPEDTAKLILAIGSLPGIQARTRLYAAMIKASVGYTAEIGEAYGIVPPAAAAPGTPGLVAHALAASEVSLSISKAGYDVLAIDSRRGGGGWEQIGVSLTATFVDTRDPLVGGAPEQREYRAQGMEGNARVGALSPVVTAVTTP